MSNFKDCAAWAGGVALVVVPVALVVVGFFWAFIVPSEAESQRNRAQYMEQRALEKRNAAYACNNWRLETACREYQSYD